MIWSSWLALLHMSNTSLYTVAAALVLGGEGKRLYAKYYRTEDAYSTQAQQTAFETALYKKINKQHQDILLYDNHLVTYKQTNDVLVVLVAGVHENELMLFSLTSNLHEALTILLDNSLDKTAVLAHYDLVCLAFDEAIDDGVVLEIDPAIIVSRVTPARLAATSNVQIDHYEKSLFNALSFASKKISEKLQQGL